LVDNTGARQERIAHAEKFFANIRADIRHRGTQAFYSQGADYIQLPPIEAFRDAESYYATLAHESAHWTKHPSRLDRELGRKQWAMKAMPEKSWSPSWPRPSCQRIWR
jgi:antirestriction protein ArdC